MQICQSAYYYLEKFTITVLETFFFCGAKTLAQETLQQRIQALVDKRGSRLQDLNVEAYQIPSSLQSKDIIVFAHTSHCLQLNPRQYDHLKNFADVVLWNPTNWTPVQYKKDLQTVIEKIRARHPEKTITVMARCATVDPAIGAVADLADKNINLILDRGHGNALQLARSTTFLSKIPFIQDILTRHFECQGEEKIANIGGKICFTTSQNDQLMQWGDQNLSEDLIKKRGKVEGDQVIELVESDHWTPWDQSTHEKVYKFMGFERVDVSAFANSSIPPDIRKVLPYSLLIKSWC